MGPYTDLQRMRRMSEDGGTVSSEVAKRCAGAALSGLHWIGRGAMAALCVYYGIKELRK